MAVVAFELLAPLASAWRPCGRGHAPLWRPDGVVGWALIAGARGDAVVCDATAGELTRHAIAINDLGQRDQPRVYSRTPGRGRILVLGDSFVEALQVGLDETFTHRLQEQLGLDVLNFGVSGYSTDNELRAFEAYGRAYHPDLVLLILYVGNDVLENGGRLYLQSSRGLPLKPWLEVPSSSPALARCLSIHRAAARAAALTPTLLWEHSRLLRFGLTSGVQATIQRACDAAIGPPLTRGVPELLGVYQPPGNRAWEEAWEQTETPLRALRDGVLDSGAVFAVAIAPAGLEFVPEMRWIEGFYPALQGQAWDFGYPHRRLEALLAAEGIPWISLLPPLRGHYASTRRSPYYEWDSHWNAEGHAIVADTLAPLVEKLL